MARIRRGLLFGILIAAAVGGVAAGRVAPARLRAQHLARFAPSLDPELANRIASDSDAEWFAHARRVGTGPLGDALQTLGQELRTDSFARFAERRPAVEAAQLRVAEAFRRVFDFPAPEARIRHDISLTPEADFAQRKLEREYIDISNDARRPPEERIRLIDGLVGRFLANGDFERALHASLVAAPCELECGRPDRHRQRLESALRFARRHREIYVQCQVLGELGVVHWTAGHEDSMRAAFDEGIALALRHGFIDHAARLLKFYASYYAQHGRLALALDRLAEGQRLCQGPGGEGAQVRLQIEYTKFVAGLGCWDLVERSLRRLPPLLREVPEVGRPVDVQKNELDAGRLRARLAFATGRAEEGSRLMRSLTRVVPAAHRRVGFAELLDEWSAGLEGAGRHGEALAVCERGLAHCDSAHVPERALPLLLRRAELLETLGRGAAAAAAIESVEARLPELPGDSDRLRRGVEILRARHEFHAGRAEAARRRIEAVFARYRSQLHLRDEGSLSYLELDDASSLHDAMHEIERFGPEAGYRFEIEWRSLGREIGGARGAARAAPAWSGARLAARPADGVHLVYRFSGDVLYRWTARPDGVVLDTLRLSAARCLGEVREAVELMQTEACARGEVLGPRSRSRLRQLSRVLLPESLRGAGDGPAHVRVSPDGPLLALPFEALPAAGPRGEQPLAQWADVAYVRGWSAPRVRADGPVVVVSNPDHPRDFESRYGGVRTLPGSEAEARDALARWPGAEWLSGRRATKDSIRACWPGASIIYVAAHHVRDPDAPFLGFMPLAAPPGAPPDAALLEIADVHALDLSACRLAVLALCSSGAPYRSAVRPGPGLADAFLDSGAQGVIRSFWDVRDDEARRFMSVFLANWREGEDDAAALGRARRQVMASPGGASPRVWAAWSVLTALPRVPASPAARRSGETVAAR